MISDYAAGIAGGIAVVLVGHPFDTTKTRLQVAPSGQYKNTVDCVRQTVEKQGFKGLYAGIVSPLAGQMVFRSLSFATFFNAVRRMSSDNSDKPSKSTLLLAGALTGLMVSIVEAPMDLVKTKLQIQIFTQRTSSSIMSSSSGPSLSPLGEVSKALSGTATAAPGPPTVLQCISNIVRTHGVKALWQGWVATAIRNIPANALFFPVNEFAKTALAERWGVDVRELQTWQRLTAGATAGLSYWVCTYPLDVIKARVQAATYESHPTWTGTARSIYNEYGWRGFTRGLAPCAFRAVPACAAMFATVDYTRLYLTELLAGHNNKSVV